MTEGPGFVTLISDQPGLRLPGDKSVIGTTMIHQLVVWGSRLAYSVYTITTKCSVVSELHK